MTETGATEALRASMEREGLGGARLMIVLGSGLGGFGEELDEPHVVQYERLEGMPLSTVPGHSGRFLRGRVEGCEVLCQQGRVHLYEGHSAEVVTRAVRAAAALGVPNLLLTNAAGGMEPSWPIPSLMRLRGHWNLTRRVPDGQEHGDPAAFDAGLAAALDEAAHEVGVPLEQGVYAGLVGPGYETAEEIQWLRRLGCHAVGMSTVLEAEAAWKAGMRVAAVSCITNPAAGIAVGALNHEEVLAAGAQAAAGFRALVRAFSRQVADSSSLDA